MSLQIINFQGVPHIVTPYQKGTYIREDADSGLKPAGIPINYRPPFRFEAGHYSNQLPAGSRL